ncbi:protein SMG7 [Tanacetum coccineum]
MLEENAEVETDLETILVEHQDFFEQREIEFALWQLHYKRIEDLRAHLTAAQNGKGAARPGPDRITKIRSQFKTFLSEATGFYHDLMVKIRAKYGLSIGYILEDPHNDVSLSRGGEKSIDVKKGLLSCHRYFIYLGDLARFKVLYGEGSSNPRDFATAASYYKQAATLWPLGGNPHHQISDFSLRIAVKSRSLLKMECNKDEATRVKEIVESKFSSKDLNGAKKFALKAQNLFPGLEGISQLLAVLDVHVATENKENAANAKTIAPNSIRTVISSTGKNVAFVEDIGLPHIFDPKPTYYLPPRESVLVHLVPILTGIKCVGPSCTNSYRLKSAASVTTDALCFYIIKALLMLKCQWIGE